MDRHPARPPDPAGRDARRANPCWLAMTLAVAGLVFGGSPASRADAVDPTTPVLGYRVVASYPHDTQAFTQGLILVEGKLYEGTGNYGDSLLRRVDLASGRVERQTRLLPRLFGEGITRWRDQLIQLTWREQLGLIHDLNTLQLRDTFRYEGEGWGITHDARHWILSDGTPVLRFLDPDSRRVVRRLGVSDGDRPVADLNELEYIKGEIWANLWKQDRIARISPATGVVTSYVDLTGLHPMEERVKRGEVLNGIAYDEETDRIFVTGKYWPRLYQIEVIAK